MARATALEGRCATTLIALTGLFESLPEATLAAVVIAASVELVDVPVLVALYRTYTARLGRECGVVARPDFIAAVDALLGVTVFDTLFMGIAVSLLLLVYRASRPYVAVLGSTPGPDGRHRDAARHRDAVTPDGIVILRLESGLYFANADAVRARILEAGTEEGVQTVILDAETTPFLDVTAARMLSAVVDELEGRDVRLLIARDVGQFRDVVVTATGDEQRAPGPVRGRVPNRVTRTAPTGARTPQ